MKNQRIKKLVEESEMPKLQKNVINRFLDWASEEKEKIESDLNLIRGVDRNCKVSKILLSNDEVKIYTVENDDPWDILYPIRTVYLNKDNIWVRNDSVSPNLDIAFLSYLQEKHLGPNSQFTFFAMKMLNLNQE